MEAIVRIIGERLRFQRVKLGYSQEITAERAGLHPTYIGQVERGEKNVTIESLEKICTALDYPMEELFKQLPPHDPTNSIANQCYQLILGQSQNEQEQLYLLLQTIIKYKTL